MWMWPAALAGLLAGCRFEPVGAGPDDAGPPPPPDVIVDAAVDAPPDATTDRDGDGVRDEDDNCIQMPNPDQANCDGDQFGDACDIMRDGPDEDGDTFSDVCDNCPTVPNADQLAVLDDDEVGDACDPQPTDGGDTIAYFSGFRDDSGGAPPEGWLLATGGELANAGWRVAGERLLLDATEQPSILYLSEEVPADVFIEARFSVIDFMGMGSDPVAFLGLLSRYTNGLASGGADAGYLCQLRQGVGDSTALVRIQDLADTMGDDEATAWSGEIGQRYTISHSQIGVTGSVSSRCTVTPPDPLLYESVRLTNIPGPASGSVALRAQRIGVAFDHIVVYGFDVAAPASPAP
jgi:hypothetical protein